MRERERERKWERMRREFGEGNPSKSLSIWKADTLKIQNFKVRRKEIKEHHDDFPRERLPQVFRLNDTLSVVKTLGSQTLGRFQYTENQKHLARNKEHKPLRETVTKSSELKMIFVNPEFHKPMSAFKMQRLRGSTVTLKASLDDVLL